VRFFSVYENLVVCAYLVEHYSGYEVPTTHEGNVSEKPMTGMQWARMYHWSMRDLFYPSSAGTLTLLE
jgi:hypothetical protein